MKLRTLAFLAGLVVAVICAFFTSSVLPWVVGGLGILVGLFNVTEGEQKRLLLCGIGLVVALTAIHAQTFNPEWLEQVVFFVRVFVAHVLLVVSFFQTAKS
jgi:uncharacterized membrane protein SirB2